MALGDRDLAKYPIRSLDRVCDLLDALRETPGGVGLAVLAARVKVPKSSVLRYLSVLEARRYVERDPGDGTYRLGLAFRPDSSDYLNALGEAALPELVRLRDRFGETVNLGVLDGAIVTHLAVAESPRSVRLAARRGESAPVHSTAIGKAIATLLDEARVRQILDSSGMPAVTPDTLTDPDSFVAEVKVSAERGYALDDCENQPDGRCVAVPIAPLALPAAVSVSAPASRFAAEDAPRVAHQLQKQLPRLHEVLRSVQP